MAIQFPQLKKTPKTSSEPRIVSTEFNSLAPSPYAAPTANMDGYMDEAVGQYNDSKFYSAKGRIGRIKFLLYPMGFMMVAYLIFMVATFALGGIAGVMMASGGEPTAAIMVIGLLGLAIIPATLYITFATAVRRLNDLNRSGWLSLLLFLPVIGLILYLYLMFAPGTPGRNDYGLPATPPSTLMKVVTFILLGLGILGLVGAMASLSAYRDYAEKAQTQANASQANQKTPTTLPTTTPTAEPAMPTNPNMPMPATTGEQAPAPTGDIEKPLMVDNSPAPANNASANNAPAQAMPSSSNEANFAQPSTDTPATNRPKGSISDEEFMRLSEGKIYSEPVRAKK